MVAVDDINISVYDGDETINVLIDEGDTLSIEMPDTPSGSSPFEIDGGIIKPIDSELPVYLPGFKGIDNDFGLGSANPSAVQGGYDTTGDLAIRQLNCGEYNMNTLANVLSTLIKDLRIKGIIKI